MAQITVNEMATQLETEPRTLRKFLRSITPKDEQPGKGSRWVLEGNKRDVAKMRKRFEEWTAAQAKPAEEPVAEVEETDDEIAELDS